MAHISTFPVLAWLRCGGGGDDGGGDGDMMMMMPGPFPIVMLVMLPSAGSADCFHASAVYSSLLAEGL